MIIVIKNLKIDFNHLDNSNELELFTKYQIPNTKYQMKWKLPIKWQLK